MTKQEILERIEKISDASKKSGAHQYLRVLHAAEKHLPKVEAAKQDFEEQCRRDAIGI